ncbi:DNA mismatch repair protein [Rachicladosporium monterosium]|uniref:DNA mismatch repair protein n=1 Tax=Rachicladosporium monterosium TaxID=1507873 RepID=A0ABR0L3X0_9PEZI|nr:DNA mismatch repair protein [Rachicladosporium monterosium]
MSRILPLPKDIATQIHSSKQIINLQGVILALIENSLDAGASKIDLTVDFRRRGCTIEDNGPGIRPHEFGEDGGLGRMYHTSKFGTGEDGSELYGSSGTHLASLAALSLLSITSRHREHHDHATLLAMGHGTHVAVRDLFGNMPVRVKQRALAEAGGADDQRAWQELKHGIAASLLAWPGSCAVKMKDVNCESRTLSLSGRNSAINGALTEKTLNQLVGKPVKSDFRDALPILFQAGITSPESRHKWVPVSASAQGVCVQGAICLDPAPTKQCQFISIGMHPCGSGSDHRDLYDAINRVVANSSFGAVDDTTVIDEAEKVRRQHDRRYKNDGYTQKQLQGRKSVDRWPMFVLQLQVRERFTSALAKSTSEASLNTMKRRRRRNEEQSAPSPALSPSLRRPSSVSGLSERIVAEQPTTPSLKRPATTTGATAKKRRIVDLSDTPGSRGVPSLRHRNSAYFDGLSRTKSGRANLLDDRWRVRKSNNATSEQNRSTATPTKDHIFSIIPDWDNPVFQKQAEEQIAVVSFDGPGLDPAEGCKHLCADHALTQHFAETGDKGTSKISKAGLKQARVIRQVDDKFILCSIPGMGVDDSHNTLVLVDQHAASERVILEGLLNELCSPVNPDALVPSHTTNTGFRSAIRTTILERPQRFLVSEKESELFAKHARHFADWGILYDLMYAAGTLAASQVRESPPEHLITVRTLPAGIAERCTLLPNLLIELLRSEVWIVAQSPSPALGRMEDGSEQEQEHVWFRRIGSCPKGIVEMLNSRACRSAIMFNDVLSVAQCEDLLADLTRCSFPFMCAHGRVSMVPLVRLGGDGPGWFSEPTSGSRSFTDAFRAWKEG